jgi:hypothetical protein
MCQLIGHPAMNSPLCSPNSTASSRHHRWRFLQRTAKLPVWSPVSRDDVNTGLCWDQTPSRFQ